MALHAVRFQLRHIFVFIGLACALIGSMARPSPLWVIIWHNAVVLLLFISLVRAIRTVGDARRFWVAFGTAEMLYLTFAMGPAPFKVLFPWLAPSMVIDLVIGHANQAALPVAGALVTSQFNDGYATYTIRELYVSGAELVFRSIHSALSLLVAYLCAVYASRPISRPN